MLIRLHEEEHLFRQIAALAFIFICTTIAWMILGSTILSRTYSRDQELRGHVASTWGSAQEQCPPVATYNKTELVPYTSYEKDGKTVVHQEKQEHDVALSLDATKVDVNLNLEHRQKGLLWYSTYQVGFTGDYKFRNDTEQAQTVTFYFRFPAQRALYDGLAMQVNGQQLPVVTDEKGASVQSTVAAKETSILHVGYNSQGLNSWRYKLADGIAQAHDFSLTMKTNFNNIDFADDTLSPTTKELTPQGWKLAWRYSNLVSGFQIGMTMPEKLQPGPLAGQISYFAPVSLFFFFFLMFMITTIRGIDLHPLNYFFLATAFFAFHLLLAYLVDHISIHAAMIISSLVSIMLVVTYLRLVVGLRFALMEPGIAQLIYLVLFSYAFFWKGFTGLAVTIISIVTLFVLMQATGRIRWSEKLGVARSSQPLPGTPT
jgi:inner membrane protein involved in colicin E2 resistance